MNDNISEIHAIWERIEALENLLEALRKHLKGHLRVYDIIDNDEPISPCNDCKFEGRASNQLPCWECDEYNLFEPKEKTKTEPEKVPYMNIEGKPVVPQKL